MDRICPLSEVSNVIKIETLTINIRAVLEHIYGAKNTSNWIVEGYCTRYCVELGAESEISKMQLTNFTFLRKIYHQNSVIVRKSEKFPAVVRDLHIDNDHTDFINIWVKESSSVSHGVRTVHVRQMLGYLVAIL